MAQLVPKVLYLSQLTNTRPQFFRLEMEYYAAAFLSVSYSIEPISVHFFKCMRSYLGNYITNVGLQRQLSGLLA